MLHFISKTFLTVPLFQILPLWVTVQSKFGKCTDHICLNVYDLLLLNHSFETDLTIFGFKAAQSKRKKASVEANISRH